MYAAVEWYFPGEGGTGRCRRAPALSDPRHTVDFIQWDSAATVKQQQ